MTSGQKGQENTTDVLEPNNRKNVGRPAVLNEVHKKYIIGIYDDNLSARPDQATNSLANEFAGLKIGEIAVYYFMKSECNLTFLKSIIHSAQKNNSDNIA